MSLTQDQARALWDAGGFAILTGLPQGSEVGLDGVLHAVASFAGYKFVPPGLHALVWSERGSASASALPLRAALIKHWAPRERAALALNKGEVEERSVDEAEVRALDPQLAPFPFNNLESWKALAAPISKDVVDAVLPGVVDSLTPVEGEADEVEEAMRKRRREDKAGEKDGATDKIQGEIAVPDTAADKSSDGPCIRLPVFDVKRSWRAGASGDEVTRWSRDKSDLWARVCASHGGPAAVLGHTALAFILVTEVWNVPAFAAYRRLVSLQCRAHAALAEPELFPDAFTASAAAAATPAAASLAGQGKAAREAALGLVDLLAAQIKSLPELAFAVEVPDLDLFYKDEIEALRRGLGAALAVRGWWGLAGRAQASWTKLQGVGRERGWAIGPLPQGDEEDDDEEGEYAPVLVEM